MKSALSAKSYRDRLVRSATIATISKKSELPTFSADPIYIHPTSLIPNIDVLTSPRLTQCIERELCRCLAACRQTILFISFTCCIANCIAIAQAIARWESFFATNWRTEYHKNAIKHQKHLVNPLSLPHNLVLLLLN
ncbi:hypothetical protein GTQ43_13110 [Nostoc sp. KVJ3]|uniref:hypothetical protein n=1 Tax=Nostoc sp. KVJ3 TaxID=457945 RepID=UPI002236F167|nr:hypothetical protein [Nostoc sp. KVJ3]MCW5314709.1 hypothetical protein [Nostoc sp. KVJ3]